MRCLRSLARSASASRAARAYSSALTDAHPDAHPDAYIPAALDPADTTDTEPRAAAPAPTEWRTRASSRRIPRGILDPSPPDAKVHYPHRARPDVRSALEPGEPWYTEIESYKYRFLDLLKAEEENEKSLITTRLANWPQEKLQRDGYCLTGLSAFWLQSTQFSKPVAAFQVGPGIVLPYHRFDKGTQVLLSRLDPLKAAQGQGNIISGSDTELRICFDEKPEVNLEEDTWRLDLFNTDIAYQRMRAAIQQLIQNPAEQEAAATPQKQPTLEGTHLRDILLGSFTPRPDGAAPPPAPPKQPGAFAQDQLIASWARRYAAKGAPVVVEGDPVLSLNATQRRAIAMMLGERVSLVQGPPGTGKTKTIIETIRLLKMHFQVPQPLLVCTYTNVAVDNLVEGLAAAGMRPLRVAFSAKVKPALLAHTLDAQIEAHALKATLDKVHADMERLRGAMERVQERVKEHGRVKDQAMLERMGTDMDAKKRRAWAVRNEMVQDIVSRADVICTTCITSASSSLRVTDFPVVFLDEASMSTEPASLIPLMKGCRHLALIGDHKQLPPVITSRKAEAGGLGVSLFERLTEEAIVPSIMLDMQYRMHPSLSRFPSSEFYNFSLQDGTVDGLGQVPLTLLPPLSSHLEINPTTGQRPSVIFLDHGGSEEMKDRSRVNHNEARIVCAVIEDLLLNNPTMKGNDIGIIAPYAAQISLLTRLLKTNAKYRGQLERTLGPLRAMQAGQIEVKTVDGFEGREKEVIIFSTVRNNAAGHIGFLADRRRMNVGLTRAKRGLFIVGSVGTLQTGRVEGGAWQRRGREEREVWGRYVEWLATNGAVRRLRGAVLEGMLFPSEVTFRA